METPAHSTQSLSGENLFLPAPARARLLSHWFPRQLVRGLLIAVLGWVSYCLISHFFLQSVTVVGASMSPTLSDSQRYLLNRWVYYVRAPQPGDVVVLRDPLDRGFSVKRVIAGPGDSVYLKDGNVYVNGGQLQESYVPAGMPTFTITPAEKEHLYRCAQDQFFVLGDNRKNSVDSRSYGPVRRPDVLGMIILPRP